MRPALLGLPLISTVQPAAVSQPSSSCPCGSSSAQNRTRISEQEANTPKNDGERMYDYKASSEYSEVQHLCDNNGCQQNKRTPSPRKASSVMSPQPSAGASLQVYVCKAQHDQTCGSSYHEANTYVVCLRPKLPTLPAPRITALGACDVHAP